MILRPVTRLIPSTNVILEDSSLPFSFVITPYSQLPPATHTSTTSTTAKNNKHKKNNNTTTTKPPLLPIGSIPKCSDCGALLNPSSPILTYPSPQSPGRFLCGLCGYTETFDPYVQCQLRDESDIPAYTTRYEKIVQDIGNDWRRSDHDHLYPERLDPVIEYEIVSKRERTGESHPPVLLVVIMDTYASSGGTSTSSDAFYSTVCATLAHVLSTAPSHAKIGICLSVSASQITVFDLRSHLPHLRTLSVKSDLLNVWDLDEVFVEVGQCRRNIEAVVRALGDRMVIDSVRERRGGRAAEGDDEEDGVGSVLDCLFDFMEDGGARHPGNEQDDGNWGYAGGKVMVFFSGWEETCAAAGGRIGTGGFGGSCAESGRRFGYGSSVGCADEEEEIMQHVEGLIDGKGERYKELGERACTMALGIELFGIDTSGSGRRDFRLTVLKTMCDRSGGCGPILVDVHEGGGKSVENAEGGTVGGLIKEVLARCPWNRPIAFGCTLRIRTSASIAVDHNPEPNELLDSHLEYATTSGITGPCTADKDDDGLLHFGTCHPTSTICCDMDLLAEYIENDESSTLVQLLFVYTSIDKNNICKRKVRVLTADLKAANDVEEFTHSLDIEALSFVLYHRLLIKSLFIGLIEIRILATEWLLSVLLSTYRSAVSYANQFQIDAPHSTYRIQHHPYFFANERLLNRRGKFNDRGVLLAQGHETLAMLPQIVFNMLQSDPLRLKCGTFAPSFDARVAAAASLGAMTPDGMMKLMAPRMELWGDKGRFVDGGERRREALDELVVELEGMQLKEGGVKRPVVVLLDSPREIVCYWYRREGVTYAEENGEEEGGNKLMAQLRRRVNEVRQSYRVAPPVYFYEKGREVDPFGILSWSRVEDALTDDSLMVVDDGLQNFEQWCTVVVMYLKEELKKY